LRRIYGKSLKNEIHDGMIGLRQMRKLSRLAKDIGAANQTSQYAYDSQGNLTDRTDPLLHTTSHDYDSLDRLIQNINPANDSSQHSFDNRDNLTAVTDPKGNTTVSGPQAQSFSYDANGSMTGNGSRQFIYNSRGRLHQVVTTQGTYQYRINGLGQRVMKIPPTGNRTLFHYDLDGQLLAETDGLGAVLKEYIRHGATPVAVVLPPSDTQSERVYSIHAEHLNTPRVIVSGSNAVLWRWDPEPLRQPPAQ
jgi:YD repeat-containing protein